MSPRPKEKKLIPHSRKQRRHPVKQNLDLVKPHGFAFSCKIEVFIIDVVHLGFSYLTLEGFLNWLLMALLLNEINQSLRSIRLQLFGKMEFEC